jgi:probable phosphoglycerate mutase
MKIHLLEPYEKPQATARLSNTCKRRRFFTVQDLYLLFFSFFFSVALGQPAWSQSTQTLRIYLARHGQTDWNVERRHQGETDTALNATGRRQATMLAERLKGIRLDMVYCSALSRSRDTAEIARGDFPLKSLAALAERRLGKFEGKRWNRRVDPEGAEEYLKRSRDPDDELDGGESLNQFYARVRAVVGEIQARHSAGAVLIVGHGLVNQMILRALLDLTVAQATSFWQANNELYLIELNTEIPPQLWKLITANNLGDL